MTLLTMLTACCSFSSILLAVLSWSLGSLINNSKQIVNGPVLMLHFSSLEFKALYAACFIHPVSFFSSFKCFDKHIGNNLDFRFLPKDTLGCKLEQPGVELQTFQLADNPLYLNHSHPKTHIKTGFGISEAGYTKQ